MESGIDRGSFLISFNLQMCVTIYNSNHTRDKLKALSDTDIRIILLYATREEATYIFKEAEKLKMTAKDFAWIVTQSVVGNAEISQPHKYLPTGILGESS